MFLPGLGAGSPDHPHAVCVALTGASANLASLALVCPSQPEPPLLLRLGTRMHDSYFVLNIGGSQATVQNSRDPHIF